MTEIIARAGESRILLDGVPPPIDIRIMSEEMYQGMFRLLRDARQMLNEFEAQGIEVDLDVDSWNHHYDMYVGGKPDPQGILTREEELQSDLLSQELQMAESLQTEEDPEKEVYLTIEFEDHGQDFLEFDVNEKGRVIGCRPAQAFHWCRHTVQNLKDLKAGEYVVLDDIDKAFSGTVFSVKYPIISLQHPF